MAQFRRPHPWDPGFALPANVMAEPPGRGTLTSVGLPRKTISGRPVGWAGGYALPDYLQAEPSGRGTATTHQDRRRTISQFIPGSLGAIPLALTLPQEVYALDGVGGSLPKPGFKGDPIKAYGQRASEFIMGTIKEVPIEFRAIALQALLDEVEPGLYDKVTKAANEYKSKGLSKKAAVKSALASQMSKGLALELLKIGQGKAPSLRSQAGLGFYGETAYEAALAGLFSSIKSGVNKVGSTIKSGATSIVKAPVRLVKQGAEKVKEGAQKAWEWGKKAVNKLGELACGVANHPAAPMAAGAVGTAYGAPPQTGSMAVQFASSMCKSGDVPAATPQQLMQPATPKWLMPAAIGGAGLVAVLLLTRK